MLFRSIAQEYELAGADAISVLTEPYWFLGSDEYLHRISKQVSLPLLRKDFTVDPYMIYEAKLLGASAVLLIVSILTDQQLKEYFTLCENLGLTAIVETHEEEEIKRALAIGARVIGVNNRNLKNFNVDFTNSIRLREEVGEQALFIAESGIQTVEDIQQIKAIGADAVLIGETLMLLLIEIMEKNSLPKSMRSKIYQFT